MFIHRPFCDLFIDKVSPENFKTL
jgi:integrase